VANKPEKFGIKSWLAADGKSKYLLNRCPYLGKDNISLQINCKWI